MRKAENKYIIKETVIMAKERNYKSVGDVVKWGMLSRLPVVIVGIASAILFLVVVIMNICLHVGGTKIRAEYTSNSQFCKYVDKAKAGGYGYDGYEAVIKDEVTDEKQVRTIDKRISDDIYIHVSYSNSDYQKAKAELDDNFSKAFDELDAKRIVITVSVDTPSYYEVKRNEYADMYYFPGSGQNYLKLKLANSTASYLVIILISAVLNVVWIKPILTDIRNYKSVH